MIVNRFGLSRTIPEDIRRQIRQECGFGCVICGSAIVQYEHIDPEFADAKEHDPKKMALLCGSCHDRVTRGYWSKLRVIEARNNPKTFKNGETRDAFDFKEPFEIIVGNNTFTHTRCIVRRNCGEEWFTVEPPESPDAPPRLNVKFFTPSGEPALIIQGNEWRCITGVWDLKIIGQVITVYSKNKSKILAIKSIPPHAIQILSLKMSLLNTTINVNQNGVIELSTNGTTIKMTGTQASSSDAIFNIP